MHRESQIQGEGEHITEGPIDQMKCAMFLFKDADLVLEPKWRFVSLGNES